MNCSRYGSAAIRNVYNFFSTCCWRCLKKKKNWTSCLISYNKLIAFNFVLLLFLNNITISNSNYPNFLCSYTISYMIPFVSWFIENSLITIINSNLRQVTDSSRLFCCNISSSGLTSAAWKCIILQKLGYKVLFRLKSTSKSRSFLKKTGEDLTRDWKRTLEDLNEFSKLYCIIFYIRELCFLMAIMCKN